MPTTAALHELSLADAEDRAAKTEALQQGLCATQPLTATRLKELCALGETMMRTGLRRRAALVRAQELFP